MEVRGTSPTTKIMEVELFSWGRWMFDCCRIPGLDGTDWSVTGAKPEDEGNAGHVAVLRNGRIWEIDISNNGRTPTTAELERYAMKIPCALDPHGSLTEGNS